MKTTKWYTIVALALMLVVGPAQQTLAAPSLQAGPQRWVVRVGGESGMALADLDAMGAMIGMGGMGNTNSMSAMMGNWDLMRFYPDRITIDAGDTVDWKLTSMEAHNILFLAPGQSAPPLIIPEGGNSQRLIYNPLVAQRMGGATFDGTTTAGSGMLGGDSPTATEYKLTFTKPGTYSYICSFHSRSANGKLVGMVGTVVVQAAGMAYPQTQAQIDDAVKAQLAADNQEVNAAEAQAAKPIPDQPGPNGTTIHTIAVGYNTPDEVGDYMRFAPTNLTIHAGDTVIWQQNAAYTAHVIALYSGGAEPKELLIEAQSGGGPKYVLNPAVGLPSGSPTYSGKGAFNSGYLYGTANSTPGPRRYALKFDTPGTYEYICSLHDQMGMNGHITVLAASINSTPMVPQTSSSAANGFGWLLALVVGLLAAGLLLKRKLAVLSR